MLTTSPGSRMSSSSRAGWQHVGSVGQDEGHRLQLQEGYHHRGRTTSLTGMTTLIHSHLRRLYPPTHSFALPLPPTTAESLCVWAGKPLTVHVQPEPRTRRVPWLWKSFQFHRHHVYVYRTIWGQVLRTLGWLLSSFTYLGFVISNQCLNLVFCLLLQLLTVVFPGAKTNVLLSIKEEMKMMVQSLNTVTVKNAVLSPLPPLTLVSWWPSPEVSQLLFSPCHAETPSCPPGYSGLSALYFDPIEYTVFVQISKYTQHMNLS